MKTKLLMIFLGIGLAANAQWYFNYSFYSAVYAFSASEGNLYLGLGGGGVYRSQDAGKNWEAVNNGIQFGGAYIFALTSRNDSIYAGGFGEVCFTQNKGENWSLINLNLSLNSFVYALAIKDNYLFAGIGGHDTTKGVYRYQFGQLGWDKVSNGLPVNVAVNAFVVKGNELFAGTNAGIYKSYNNGLDWSASFDGMGGTTIVKALHLVNGYLLAGTNAGIFVSSSNGYSWTPAAGLPTDAVFTCIASNGSDIVAGTYNGAFLSNNNGYNWIEFSPESPPVVSFFSLTTLGNDFYAGTGGGVYTTNADVAVSVNETGPGNGGVLSVFPNPFHAHTSLHFSNYLNRARLIVYNSFGQAVREIGHISGKSFTFSRDNLPAGIYFMQLEQDGKQIATRKILIIE